MVLHVGNPSQCHLPSQEPPHSASGGPVQRLCPTIESSGNPVYYCRHALMWPSKDPAPSSHQLYTALGRGHQGGEGWVRGHGVCLPQPAGSSSSEKPSALASQLSSPCRAGGSRERGRGCSRGPQGGSGALSEGIDQDCSFGTVFRTRDRGMGAMALQGLLGGSLGSLASLGKECPPDKEGSSERSPAPAPLPARATCPSWSQRERPPGLGLSSTV